jgi:class 3 adenylate cyclase/alpha-beta hydrolase superfamily lysophospholipase
VIVAPEVRYARSGDLSIAYQVVGEGPVDLILVPGMLDHLDTTWEQPETVRSLEAMARFSRVILFDRRGSGMSDRLPADVVPTAEEQVQDVLAVLDAVGTRAAVVIGVADGGAVALSFVVAHPERVRGLALYSVAACGVQRPGFPWGPTAEVLDQWLALGEREWGTGAFAMLFGESSEAVRAAIARMERRACTPRAAVAMARTAFERDLRPLLPRIRVPTVVIATRDHPLIPVDGVRYLAEHIAGARYIERAGFSTLEEVTRRGLAEAVEELVTGSAAVAHSDRVLVAVLFTDIVDSTGHAARLGDRRWHDLLNEHDQRVRAAVERAGGRIVKTTGDGVLARFDGAGRALACAQVIVAEGHRLGLGVRAGVHAGDCEPRGDDLAGLTVHVGARVAALAGTGEVLVTGTVRDLVLGSGLGFEERGTHALRGVPGEWAVLALRAGVA